MATLRSAQSCDTNRSGSSLELSPTSSYETRCGEALGLESGAHADWPPRRDDES